PRGKLVRALEPGLAGYGVSGLVLAPKGELVIVAREDVRLFALDGGRDLDFAAALGAHLALSPTGESVAVVDRMGSLAVLDVADGACVWSAPAAGWSLGHELAFPSEGRVVVASGDSVTSVGAGRAARFELPRSHNVLSPSGSLIGSEWCEGVALCSTANG